MKKFVLAVCCVILLWACSKPEEKVAEPAAEPAPPADIEFADAKYTEIGKQGIAALSSGDIDAWMNSYADNAKYYWSGGDSLIGKKAIGDYWKDRRGNVIESLKFINDVWIPIKVNKSQRGPDRPGVWLLSWYQIDVKYKNGKSVGMWVHMDLHFDANDKIDQVVQYIDRAPINAALAKK